MLASVPDISLPPRVLHHQQGQELASMACTVHCSTVLHAQYTAVQYCMLHAQNTAIQYCMLHAQNTTVQYSAVLHATLVSPKLRAPH